MLKIILVITNIFLFTANLYSQHYFLYNDSLTVKHWHANNSWNTNFDLAATEFVYVGSKSISIEYVSRFAGFNLYTANFNTSGYDTLGFFINGGSNSGQSFWIKVSYDGKNFNDGVPVTNYVSVEAGKWKEVKIPLKDFGADNTFILALAFQENKGSYQPKIFVDNIYLKTVSGNPVILDTYFSSYNAFAGDELSAQIRLEDSDGLGDISKVSLNLSELKSGTEFILYDDGVHSDNKSGDGIFGNKFKILSDTKSGEYKILVNVEDKKGNKSLRKIWFGVMQNTGDTIPNGIPKYFSIGTGTSSSTLAWQTSNGNECWDMGYQYLTWGWWNWYAGGFVKRFCDDAKRRGYIPIIPIYLFQSGADGYGCTGSEYDKTFCTINNAAMMNEFWKRFIQMCDEAKSSLASRVIFHIEPDMLGYLQQRAINEKKDPTTITAIVGDLRYSNTLRGMHKRMVDLVREQTGGKGLIAFHASLWGNISSLKDNTEKNLNVDSLAKSTADFLIQCSPDFDLVFTDWSDRDAGFDGVWWDKKNTSVPNFSRVILFNNLISHYTGKKTILWQIPVGNEKLPNKENQYTDNRADYLFDYRNDIAKSGIISMLFGAGIPQMTTPQTDNGNLRNRALEYCSTGK
ncbi:MAG: hypothetical protein KKH32_08490, partial [Bacteroidetes bacterium]|nr:hypothetical protein [Bacteroidota bacterium]